MADAPDDLAALFPNLAGIVSNWQGGANPSTDPLANDPNHSGVTDEAITEYFANRLGGRAPLAPVVNGQQVPGAPQFQSGVGGPAPASAHVEGDGASGGASEVQLGQEPSTGSIPSDHVEPSAPQTDPLVSVQPEVEGGEQEGISDPTLSQESSLPEFIELGDRRIPTERVQAWDQFDEMLRTDPMLRQAIAQYMTTGQLPGPGNAQPIAPVAPGAEGVGVQPPQIPSAPTPTPFQPLTPPADLDMDDPAIKSLWSVMEQQNRMLAGLAQNQSIAQQQYAAQAMQSQEAIVNGALTQFKAKYDLNDAELSEVRTVAARLNVVESFMQGVDPITGAPVTPDANNAVMRALELGYNSLPQYKDREFERLTRQRLADNARKQKAGSLSGSSGSTPRTTPAPTTEAGRKAALHDEVAKMFAGNWSAPDQ